MSVYGVGVYGAGLFGFGGFTPGSVHQTTVDTGPIIFGATDSKGVRWVLLRGSDPFGNTPAPRDVSGERATAHGTWNATEFYEARSWNISLHVHAPTHEALHEAHSRLNAACGLRPFPVAVDEPHFGPRMAWFRRVGEIMWNEETPTLARATLTLRADDPLILGLPKTVASRFPQVVGGRSWPTAWPGSWDAVVSAGVVTLTNDGTEPASIGWRIDGPVVDPLIVDDATGRTLRTDLTLAGGEWLWLDTATERALANGEPDASRDDRVYGDWFDLDPGSAQVHVGGTGLGASSLVTATWADTYI